MRVDCRIAALPRPASGAAPPSRASQKLLTGPGPLGLPCEGSWLPAGSFLLPFSSPTQVGAGS